MKKNVKVFFVGILLSATVFTLTQPSYASTCIKKYCTYQGDPWNEEVDCGVSFETYATNLPPGTVVEQTELILTDKLTNCDTVSKPRESPTKTFAISEALTHSCSGDMKVEIGGAVGYEAVKELKLTHSQTQTNGWQYADTWSDTSSYQFKDTVPGCSQETCKYFGKYWSGGATGGGSATIHIYHRYTFGSWHWDLYSCPNATTSSNASGANKIYHYYNTVFSAPYAATTDICANCPNG